MVSKAVVTPPVDMILNETDSIKRDNAKIVSLPCVVHRQQAVSDDRGRQVGQQLPSRPREGLHLVVQGGAAAVACRDDEAEAGVGGIPAAGMLEVSASEGRPGGGPGVEVAALLRVAGRAGAAAHVGDVACAFSLGSSSVLLKDYIRYYLTLLLRPAFRPKAPRRLEGIPGIRGPSWTPR